MTKFYEPTIDHRQTHTVNIVYHGNFAMLINYLESKGIEIDFIPPGLVGSASVMEIKPEKESNDEV